MQPLPGRLQSVFPDAFSFNFNLPIPPQRCSQLLEERDGQGRRAAEAAVEAMSMSEQTRMQVIKAFLDAGLDVHAQHPHTGETLLHSCARYGGTHITRTHGSEGG